MTDTKRLLGLLGMSRRAGRLAVGFDAALTAVRDGKSPLIVIAADASQRTDKECRFAAASHDAAVVTLPLDKAALAAAIGAHKPVAVAAIGDDGFAKAIRSCCIEET